MQRKKSLVYLKNIILFAFSSGFCFCCCCCSCFCFCFCCPLKF